VKVSGGPKIIKMHGGLGNQLFCLAFAHTVSRVSGEPVAVDIAAYASDRYGRRFVLTELAERLGIEVTHRPWLASRPVTAMMRLFSTEGYVCEGARAPSGGALNALIARGAYFNGYWQNEAYFSGAQTFRQAARAFLLSRRAEANTGQTVIHLRTYKEEIRSAWRAIPAAAYFRHCVDRLEARPGGVGAITLVSDDPTLALAHLGDLAGRVRLAPKGDMWADMALMLGARAIVLTNSSFSWWGGYCGEAETIFYPARDRLAHYAQPARRFTVV